MALANDFQPAFKRQAHESMPTRKLMSAGHLGKAGSDGTCEGWGNMPMRVGGVQSWLSGNGAPT